VTERDLKTYDTLLKSTVGVRWTNEDVKTLLDEVRRLRGILEAERPVALRDHWVGTTRFVGGH
jgi:hypothetical protein